MPFYLSKSLGGGLRIGTRIGGGYGRRSDPSCLVTIVQAVLLLGIIGLFITNWPIAIALFVLWAIGTGWWSSVKEKEDELEQRRTTIAPMERQVEKHVGLVKNAKTLSARQNNCTKALALLNEIKALDPSGQIADVSDLLTTLSATGKLLPVVGILDKAERAEFKGQKQQAMNAYLDALYQCQKEKVSDNDFKLADLRDSSTGHHVSIEYLREKACNNGWTGPSNEVAPTQSPSVDMSQEFECPYCQMTSPYRMFDADENGKGHCPCCNVPVEFE